MLNIKFLKKYVQVAKILKPVLSRDAANCIAEEYAKLRSMDQENTSNVARVTNAYAVYYLTHLGLMIAMTSPKPLVLMTLEEQIP